jgi:dTDP-glucose 4,6-dehydratase
MKILVTGGAGFIGSALIRHLIQNTEHEIINIDKLSYASNHDSLSSINENPRYQFYQIDICNFEAVSKIFETLSPDAVMHLAAESHVDRSIFSSSPFIQTNILGTHNLLEISRLYWSTLIASKKSQFKFIHISTDEVYGDLTPFEPAFTESHPYAPSSPYSASKASSDHLVKAWHRTYGLPTIISNCSNNYGPFQFPEKLIPLTILNAINNMPIQVYGNGEQIRDWLYVEDHVEALNKILHFGKIGETYNIGGCNEQKNIDVVYQICDILDEIHPHPNSFKKLIRFISDRPGHDTRYAINISKIKRELNWSPKTPLSNGLKNTIHWYLNNKNWAKNILNPHNNIEANVE